jgi:GH25 family lysozyme M1 (1,4-beta-N-acetylmuramidase)
VDWVKVKASGVAFGFAKASERTAVDPTFVRNWKAMQGPFCI